MKVQSRGGARPGAGRKKGEPHKTISFRVPAKHSEIIHKYLKNLLDEKLNRTTKKDLNTNRNRCNAFVNDLSR